MPDVIIHHVEEDWLVLIEALTSHGPINTERRKELAALFQDARPRPIYVTAALTHNDIAEHVTEIAWETVAWIQEAGPHLIHFGGKRSLCTYDS
jgi:dTDP-4-dehydrorhamnose reductase